MDVVYWSCPGCGSVVKHKKTVNCHMRKCARFLEIKDPNKNVIQNNKKTSGTSKNNITILTQSPPPPAIEQEIIKTSSESTTSTIPPLAYLLDTAPPSVLDSLNPKITHLMACPESDSPKWICPGCHSNIKKHSTIVKHQKTCPRFNDLRDSMSPRDQFKDNKLVTIEPSNMNITNDRTLQSILGDSRRRSVSSFLISDLGVPTPSKEFKPHTVQMDWSTSSGSEIM
ncbi:developmentally-regulated protein [Acrasis kona]|uniref:Developmentally-regulated protein n=1 Tax=Acrasis kona TaxID=1008807 RepID=A0AAW2Z8W6_9EUKA